MVRAVKVRAEVGERRIRNDGRENGETHRSANRAGIARRAKGKV